MQTQTKHNNCSFSFQNNARMLAWSILNFSDESHQTLDQIFDKALDKDINLSNRDRSLANALVYGILRWKNYLDWIIGYFSKTPMGKIDPKVLNVLRLALFQIFFMDRIPASASVNTAVEITKSFAGDWVVRYVNGLLRTVLREYKSISPPDLKKDPAFALSIIKSFPSWLMQKWLKRFSLEEIIELCDAINSIPPITIRVNALKTTKDQLEISLARDIEKIVSTQYIYDSIHLYGLTKSIFEMEAFNKGWFQVQDEAAQLISLLLDPKPEENILDACAGLGGKTGHIAQMMKNRGHIISVDKDEEKLLRLTSEMNRLEVLIVSTSVIDLNCDAKQLSNQKFDRILLDAPCSGLGVMRRNPDIKWKTNRKNLKNYKNQQLSILSNLAPFVKDSGVMVYAVCSMEPEENEEVVYAFLKDHPDFNLDIPKEEIWSKMPTSVIDHNGYLKTFPHIHGMDGFFAARLIKV